MKKTTILLVIIFTFLFSTTSWGEWSYVSKSVEGDKNYYDKDRIRKSTRCPCLPICSTFPVTDSHDHEVDIVSSFCHGPRVNGGQPV